MTRVWPILFAVSMSVNVLQFALSRIPVPPAVLAARAKVANFAVRCEGRTLDGLPCGRIVRRGERYCHLHRTRPAPSQVVTVL